MKFKLDIKKCILILLAGIVFASVIYIDNCALVNSFDQILFHVMKFKGSSSSSVLPAVIYIVIASVIMWVVLLLPVIDLGKKIVIKIKDRCIQLYPFKRIKLYGIIVIVIACILLLDRFHFFSFIWNNVFSSTEIFDEYYVDGSDVDITFSNKKRNLIYIFVESLESSNVSKENGGVFKESIIPNLEELALDNINFSNNDKIGGAISSPGTEWTAAGMISQTSGVPIKVSIDDFKVDSLKFDNVTSIGDILKKNGYNNYLLLGSDASFGGRRSYFDNHNYIIKDYYTAIDDGIIEEGYYEWWGYEDSKLFGYAKKLLSDIAKDDEPFNFTLLTSNTHFTDGYMEKECSNKFDDAYSNSFYCFDNMINDFIKWVKEQDFYDDTTIIIVGDHITMQNGFYKDDDYDRTVYNVFINTDIDISYNNKNRIFTSFDMFPTTIYSIGGNIEGDRIGFGTNLFSDKDTVPEIIGIDKFNIELAKSSSYYYDYIRK